jgi:hypothetical protein
VVGGGSLDDLAEVGAAHEAGQAAPRPAAALVPAAPEAPPVQRLALRAPTHVYLQSQTYCLLITYSYQEKCLVWLPEKNKTIDPLPFCHGCRIKRLKD